MKYKSRSVQLDWGAMAYWDTGGAGMPLLFLHGTGCDASDWEETARWISPGIRLIAMDFRGHGGSATPDGPFTFTDLALDVCRLVEHLALPAVVLAGHSLGGMAAMLAAQHCDQVAGLVLLEGWTRLAASGSFMDGRFYGHLDPSRVEAIRGKYDAMRKRIAAEIWEPFWKSVQASDGYAWLEKAGIPVIEAYGSLGKEADTESRLCVPSNPRIAWRWIDGAGHYLPHEAPRETAEACMAGWRAAAQR